MEPDTNRKDKRARSSNPGRSGSKKETTTEPRRNAGGRPPREELTAQQLRGINALISQPTMAAAAKQISVHPRTISRWFREPAFRKEYVDQMGKLQLELWRQMLSVRHECWSRFLLLLRSGDERIAIRASTWFLERLLSVPPMMGRLDADDGPNPVIPPRLVAFLEDAEAAEGSEEDDAT